MIEAPDLAACLTLSKNDFIRTGPRGASYLAYRKAIQEVVSRQLAEWGDGRDVETRPRTARLERDLERVLEDLADDFPLLQSLVDRRTGGQKRLPMPGRGEERVPPALFANLPVGDESTVEESASPPAPGPPRNHKREPPHQCRSRDLVRNRRNRRRGTSLCPETNLRGPRSGPIEIAASSGTVTRLWDAGGRRGTVC